MYVYYKYLSFFFFFSSLLPLCLNKVLARDINKTTEADMDQGVWCRRSWRLWESKGHLVTEYEGPLYYNFANDK